MGESSTTLHLIVTSPRHVSVEPDLLVADFSSSAQFKCHFKGQMKASIKWLKDGHQLLSSENTLRLSNVQTEDGGVYQCFVTFEDGQQFQASGELRLGDILPQMVYSFIEQTVQPGPLVSLKCSASGNPTPRIIWTLDGYPLPENDRYFSYYLQMTLFSCMRFF